MNALHKTTQTATALKVTVRRAVVLAASTAVLLAAVGSVGMGHSSAANIWVGPTPSSTTAVAPAN